MSEAYPARFSLGCALNPCPCRSTDKRERPLLAAWAERSWPDWQFVRHRFKSAWPDAKDRTF
jgi:hypothetical protein